MGMGISSFYNQAITKDFSRDFQMRVLKIGPGVLTEKDNVYITTSVLPGYAITNQAVPFMGLQFNIPGSGNFPGSDSWAVTFRCDQQLNIREKLVTWQKTIFNSFPNEAGNSVGSYGPKYTESVADLVIFGRDGKNARSVQLIGVYPVTIGEVSYDTTGGGAPVTLAATLAYQWWQAVSDPGKIIP